MKNVFVANFRDSKLNSTKQYPLESLVTDLKCQIENSIQCENKDILVVTNFDFSFMGINSITFDLNNFCLTGSKMFALEKLFQENMINDYTWIHDLDAWQCLNFKFPDIKDIGVAEYSRPKYNGGSVFITPDAKDIIFDICNYLRNNSEVREEPTLDKFLRGIHKSRTTTVNSTYNLGCSGYKERYLRSEKPIKVVHFHPTNRLAWSTHTRNKNRISKDAVIPDRLKNLFLKYYEETISNFIYEDGLSYLTILD